ncbi:MAG: rubredoxin [Candidatus Melainabacteria bacterium]|nr:rubredoxin [Candidatus Melainabacteria bacterium]
MQASVKNNVAEFDCYFCDRCRDYVYDELIGDASREIPPHTWVESLPKSWKCPICGSSAEELRAVTLFDDFSEDEFVKNGFKERVDDSRKEAG